MEFEGELSHEARESLRGDLQKMQQFFENDFKREDTNGVGVFSCSALGFWQVFEMPTRVQSQVYFGPRPHVAPLATFLSHTKPTAILMTDRQQARIITMAEGEVKEWTQFEDFVPQRSEAGGWSQMRYQRRSDEWANHHIDHAAELALRLEQNYPFDWLLLAVDEEAKNEIESTLHPYLKDRVIGTITVRIDAPLADVVQKAREASEQQESQLIDRLMGQIQEFAGAGGRGTIGLSATLQALNEQKVHVLLVQEGYSEPGGECPNCGMLYAGDVQMCAADGETLQPVEDIVDSAIQKAFELGSRVEVATEYEKLNPIESIGSIMYY
jgi:peptide subunit release factor 1 (eRF1)